MSEQKSHKTTVRQRIVRSLLILAVSFVGFGIWFSTLPSYWQEMWRVQTDVLDEDHDANDQQLGRDIKAGRQNRKPNSFTMQDINNDRRAVMPAMDRSAQIDQIGMEAEARLQHKYLPVKTVWMPATQSTWLDTDIPIYAACMRVKVSGTISRGGYGESGPEGIHLDKLVPADRESWVSLNTNKRTLFNGTPWGAVIVKSCTDSQSKSCGAAIPSGEERYLSARQLGGGTLRAMPNGFVSGNTDRFLVLGIEGLNMSDYNSYQGGFRISWQEVPENMCDSSISSLTRVAQR